MLQKTVVSGVYKDEKSGALVNKDNDRLSSYRKEKQLRRDIQGLKDITNGLVLRTELIYERLKEIEQLMKSKV